ncbi:MAG: phage shock protein PspA [Thermodesulfobacteriota bacterium]
MGVFSRFKDIVSSNLNSLLDKAEDPRKLIRLMIQEMEETLVELKAGCAKSMADRKTLDRELAAAESLAETWEDRAALAVDKGRDDLAREALAEKRRFLDRADGLRAEAVHLDELVAQAREDIGRLDEKLAAARDKQRLLVSRHARASARLRAGEKARPVDNGDAMLRFDQFERRIERLEAEAELSAPRSSSGLEREFAALAGDEAVERELAALKQRKAGGAGDGAGRE